MVDFRTYLSRPSQGKSHLSPKQLLLITLFLTIIIKFFLALSLPLFGDEAYFLIWGQHLDLGYYDHPPMIGWILHLLLYLGDAPVLLRLPVIFMFGIIGVIIFLLLRAEDEQRAAGIAILYLVSPVNLLAVLVTTDMPLILFSFFSVAALFKALEKNNMAWYACSGFFLGAAFISKYFSVLLGFAYIIYFIFAIYRNSASNAIGKTETVGRSYKIIYGACLLFLVFLPFLFLNLYWNYLNCWDNIMFNLINRNVEDKMSIDKVLIYLVQQIYLITPVVLFYICQSKKEIYQQPLGNRLILSTLCFFVPMLVFALLSIKKVIGLHWVLSFYPFFYVLLFDLLTREQLAKTTKFMICFSLAHLAAISAVMSLPIETWKFSQRYDALVLMMKSDEIINSLRPYEKQGFIMASDGFNSAALFSYHYRQRFAVLGPGSFHGRYDDHVTDFREFNGRNILIVKKSSTELDSYLPYFRDVKVRYLNVHGAKFYLLEGYRFNYEKYHDTVLRFIKNKYYNIPSFLPYGQCYFNEKYFPKVSR